MLSCCDIMLCYHLLQPCALSCWLLCNFILEVTLVNRKRVWVLPINISVDSLSEHVIAEVAITLWRQLVLLKGKSPKNGRWADLLLVLRCVQVSVYSEWELCSPMSVKLRQLHMCSTCVLNDSESCWVIQALLYKTKALKAVKAIQSYVRQWCSFFYDLLV